MTPYIYYGICALLTLMVLGGIWMMSRVQTAKAGNQLSALSMLLAIVFTLVYHQVFSAWTVSR
ncbi:MAG: hypothetical protein Q4A64_05260 [Porphyromonadaceae bacterium]|nr:hypothetical protein [Porphyromonadaceae bacterium]